GVGHDERAAHGTRVPCSASAHAGVFSVPPGVREAADVTWRELMAQRPQYTIGEVVERTGVPATTIHHYRNLGLLPPPEKVGTNRFAYDERHVQAVRLVRLLRDRRHLSLETIRDVLPELLAVDEEAFRPDMWDQVVASHRSAYGLSDREGSTRRAI